MTNCHVIFSVVLSVVLSFVFAASSATLSAQQAESSKAPAWSQFRGPMGDGIAPKTSAPRTTWTKENYKWNTPLPGKGWSSPVYADGKIWMTSAITAEATKEEIDKALEGKAFKQIKTVAGSVEMHALCVDLETGKLLHDIKLGKVDTPEPINPMNSYASPTCAISQGRVVCHFGNYGTWCLDASSGEERWTQKYEIDHSVGAGSSPVIIGENVVIVCDGCDKQFIVAVSMKTGKEAWKTARPPIKAANGEMRKAYSTPVVIEVEGKKQFVVPGAQWICGYSVEDGKEIWRFDHGSGFSITPMAAYEDGMLVFSTCYGQKEYVAVRPEGTGDISKTAKSWRERNAPAMPSFIAKDGLVYGISDTGVLICLEAGTGKVVNKKRILGNVSASPLLAGGNLYFANRDGQMKVVKCDRDMKVVSEFDFKSPVYATPTVVGNDLIMRTADSVIRISKD